MLALNKFSGRGNFHPAYYSFATSVGRVNQSFPITPPRWTSNEIGTSWYVPGTASPAPMTVAQVPSSE